MATILKPTDKATESTATGGNVPENQATSQPTPAGANGENNGESGNGEGGDSGGKEVLAGTNTAPALEQVLKDQEEQNQVGDTSALPDDVDPSDPAVVNDPNTTVGKNIAQLGVEDNLERPINRATATDGEPVVVYRHKNTRRFQVGKFEFVNHLLFIFNDDDADEFMHLYDSLMPVDQVNIVEYNWSAAQGLERPVGGATATRGALGTSSIRDPKRIV